MTSKKRVTGKAGTKKLKLKKETIRNLDANKAKAVRGGMIFVSIVKGACGPLISSGCDLREGKTVTCAAKYCG
jgi:hypothetical protein